jgi:lipoic acid synthetase
MSNLPSWMIKRTPKSQNIKALRSLVDDPDIHTVCESAKCPNIGECYSAKTMTFMILGNVCTRACRFCAVAKGAPSAVDPTEPQRIAKAVRVLDLKYVVVTSVTRDDLPDGGSSQFAKTIKEVRDGRCETRNPTSHPSSPISVEVLIPDFKGDQKALKTVIDAKPDVLNHNIETVPALYDLIRPQADYQRSLEVLRSAKKMNDNICTKSGLMLGLGESFGEVEQVLQDLRKVRCDMITIGQYISPSKDHAPVAEYVNPEIFEKYKVIGLEMGFRNVFSGPFVRSSYQAQMISEKVR